MTAIMVGTAAQELANGGLSWAMRETLASHENNVDTGIVYYRTPGRMDVTVVRQALRENPELSDVDKAGMCAEFHEGQWVGLGAELSAVLFDSLARYGTGNPVCAAGRDGVTVHGGFSRGVCDCRMRRHALKWAAQMATQTMGIQFAE